MITIKNVRLAYPSLFTPSAFQDQAPKYSATFLIPKTDTETLEAINNAIRTCAKNAFGDKAKKVLANQDSGQRQLLKDGDEKTNREGDQDENFAGHYYIKASAKPTNQPKVVGRKRQEISEEDGIIYSGCVVNAQLEFWAQKNSFGHFVNCQLLAVQFWKDGEAFGGVARANIDAFDAAEDDEDDQW